MGRELYGRGEDDQRIEIARGIKRVLENVVQSEQDLSDTSASSKLFPISHLCDGKIISRGKANSPH